MSKLPAGEPAPPHTLPWWRHLANILLDRGRAFIGGPLVVIAAGFMVLWWSFFQMNRGLDRMVERTTATTEGRLVERYYLVEPAPVPKSNDPYYHPDDTWIYSVAVFEYQAGGQLRRGLFWEYTSDWQQPGSFEDGIPQLDAPIFKIARGVSPEKVEQLREAIDRPGHWLLRLREQPLAWRMPLRYDPDDPSVVLLDSEVFRMDRIGVDEYWSGLARGMIFFAAFFTWFLMIPGLRLLLPSGWGIKTWHLWSIAGAIFLSMPLWAPYGQKIAPFLSDESGSLANFLVEEFGNTPTELGFVAGRREMAVEQEIVWRMEESEAAKFYGDLNVARPAVGPLDFTGAYDLLRNRFRDQLAEQLETGSEPELVETVNRLWRLDWESKELMVPGVLRFHESSLPSAEASPEQTLHQISGDFLSHFANGWPTPDVDQFLFEHRLLRFGSLAAAGYPQVNERREAAHALIRVQQAPTS